MSATHTHAVCHIAPLHVVGLARAKLQNYAKQLVRNAHKAAAHDLLFATIGHTFISDGCNILKSETCAAIDTPVRLTSCKQHHDFLSFVPAPAQAWLPTLLIPSKRVTYQCVWGMCLRTPAEARRRTYGQRCCRNGCASFDTCACMCSAKSLVRDLLTTNPSKRLTSTQALQHSWFTASLHSNEDLRLARRNMKRHLRQRFKVCPLLS